MINNQSGFFKKMLLTAFFVLACASIGFAQSDESFTFKVFNNTNKVIKQILVSEDGEEYKYFDIGNGIGVGKTVTLVWDESTDEESCIQYFKAVFSNKEVSEPVAFDFCEDNLVLEFKFP